MNDDIFLSIIIPVYNVECFIEECLESLVSQMDNRIEVILVDDGSTDNSGCICDIYASKMENTIVIHKSNGGLVSARKAGLDIAKGKYCWNIDSDDWIEANSINQIIEILLKYQPEVLCFGFNSVSISDTVHNPLRIKEGFYSKDDINKSFFDYFICDKNGKSFPSSVWGKIFDLTLFKKYYVKDETICMGEDAATVPLCIFFSNSMYVINRCLYNYRFNDSSITKQKKPIDILGPKKRKKHIKTFLPESEKNIMDQLDRQTAIALYTAVKSQFYSKEYSYKQICKIVKETLDDYDYALSLKNAKFNKLTKNYKKVFLLRLRLLFFIKIWG